MAESKFSSIASAAMESSWFYEIWSTVIDNRLLSKFVKDSKAFYSLGLKFRAVFTEFLVKEVDMIVALPPRVTPPKRFFRLLTEDGQIVVGERGAHTCC